MTKPYATPQALRQGATARLRKLAAQRMGAQLSDLLRQFAYDRLLARAFTADPDRWVLKGAAAMLARLPDAARHSKDIDLCSQQGDLVDAENALREAAALDLGDHFRFTPGSARPIAQGARAVRMPITAYLGPTEFASFHVDVVVGRAVIERPDEVPPLVDIDLGLPQPKYRAHPVPDHIADKVCAMLETHARHDGTSIASTRYRDLVDLATFARCCPVDGHALAGALRSEARRRDLELPPGLPDPTGADWGAGYARSARDAPTLPDRDLASALSTVRALLDPVLSGAASGRWDPARQTWRPPGQSASAS